MNWLNLLFWLFILSDGTAAAVGARAAWIRKVRSTGKRPEFATAFGIGFALYAGVQYLMIFNQVASSRYLATMPPGYLLRATLLRVAQSFAIWLIALTLQGRSPITSSQQLLSKAFAKSKKGETRMESDKDPAAKDLVDDLQKDQDPNAPQSPAPETDDGDETKKDGEPIGPGE